MSIPFTRFHLPDGRREEGSIDLDPETEASAQTLIDQGARFEIEMLTNGVIHLDCNIQFQLNEDTLLANALCENGPSVIPTVKGLVRDATERLFELEVYGE